MAAIRTVHTDESVARKLDMVSIPLNSHTHEYRWPGCRDVSAEHVYLTAWPANTSQDMPIVLKINATFSGNSRCT